VVAAETPLVSLAFAGPRSRLGRIRRTPPGPRERIAPARECAGKSRRLRGR
jgi:hypothetical protein